MKSVDVEIHVSTTLGSVDMGICTWREKRLASMVAMGFAFCLTGDGYGSRNKRRTTIPVYHNHVLQTPERPIFLGLTAGISSCSVSHVAALSSMAMLGEFFSSKHNRKSDR